jgi:hypothetical protein
MDDLRADIDYLADAGIDLLREGTYGPTGSEVYYEDSSTIDDLRDLYVVLSEQTANGSKNLPNDQVLGMLEHVEEGHPLSDVEIGTLKQLLARFATELAKLRATPDKQGQNWSDVPDPGSARLTTGG